MEKIALSLKVKYGLSSDPSYAQVQKWINLTNEYISKGFGYEDAGAKAAKDIFPDVEKWFYKAESDTVYSLLQAAKNKTFTK